MANEWVATLQAREHEPTRDLHVLAGPSRQPFATRRTVSRGVIAGLTLEHGPDALARRYLATVQALAYGTRHIIEALNEAGHRIERVVMCGGGAKNPLSLREHADATGCDLHLASEDEAVALGAAILAGALRPARFPTFRRPPRDGASRRLVPRQSRSGVFHDAKYAVFRALCQDWRATAT